MAAIPSFFRLTLNKPAFYPPLPHRIHPPLPFLPRALSSASTSSSAVQTPDAAIPTSAKKVVRPQWKAAIDFKWIKDNKVPVEANIKNRNSCAYLEHLLELYEKLLDVQKARRPGVRGPSKKCLNGSQSLL